MSYKDSLIRQIKRVGNILKSDDLYIYDIETLTHLLNSELRLLSFLIDQLCKTYNFDFFDVSTYRKKLKLLKEQTK